MTWRQSLCIAALSAGLLIPVSSASAAKAKEAKEYQVTGPVTAVDDNLVTVQKGDEKWQIEVGPDVKVDGKIAVGQKITIYYKMIATKVEKKDSKDAKKK